MTVRASAPSSPSHADETAEWSRETLPRATSTMWSSWMVITPIRHPSPSLAMAISQDLYCRRATRTTVWWVIRS